MTSNKYKTMKVLGYMVSDELKSYAENPSSSHVLHDIATLAISQRIRNIAANIYWDITQTKRDGILEDNDYQAFVKTQDALHDYLNPRDSDIFVCNWCGGTDVTTSSYTNPNKLEDSELSENDDYDSCDHCYEDIEIITLQEWKERIKNGSPH